MATTVEFPTLTTTMSLQKLGTAATEYGCAARELAEADLYTEDSFGNTFGQEDLTQDIIENGVQEPIEIGYNSEEESWNRFSILNGHHRYIAARNAGLMSVPVVITADSLLRTDADGKLYAVTGRLPSYEELI
jgi:hypothetical protein